MLSVSILGTNYEVIAKKYSEEPSFERDEIDGYCDSLLKQIVYCEMATYKGWENESKESWHSQEQLTLRHEIVHAFFNESGLQDNALCFERSWAKNEEMVDWIALQGPKIYAAWQEVGAL